jgi:hypothetical protein
MATKKETTSLYNVLKPVRHNDDRYTAGETIELTPTEAAGPLSCKAISPVPVAPVAQKEAK